MGRMEISAPNLKRLLSEKFDILACSARRGRGTAYNWWYITTTEPVDYSLQKEVGEFLVDNNFASSYYTDYGPNNTYSPCIRWEVRKIPLDT